MKRRKYVLRWLFFLVISVLTGCYGHHHLQTAQFSYVIKKLQPHYVSVRQGQMEYYEFGHGTPMVLIPGYVTDISSWNQKFLLELAQQHHVILINNRNVGGSQSHSSRYESQDLAEDIYQVIHALRLKKPAILGISMGGMIAQKLAVLHPDALGALILINTAIAGKQSIHPAPNVEREMLAMPTHTWGRYKLAVELFFPPTWRLQMAYALATDRFQPKYYKKVDPAAIIPAQRHLLMHWLTDDTTGQALKRLNLPVLILNGGMDAVIPPVNSVILARTIPRAQFIRWRDGGHAMNYQYPVQIAQAINRFIAARH